MPHMGEGVFKECCNGCTPHIFQGVLEELYLLALCLGRQNFLLPNTGQACPPLFWEMFIYY